MQLHSDSWRYNASRQWVSVDAETTAEQFMGILWWKRKAGNTGECISIWIPLNEEQVEPHVPC